MSVPVNGLTVSVPVNVLTVPVNVLTVYVPVNVLTVNGFRSYCYYCKRFLLLLFLCSYCKRFPVPQQGELLHTAEDRGGVSCGCARLPGGPAHLDHTGAATPGNHDDRLPRNLVTAASILLREIIVFMWS